MIEPLLEGTRLRRYRAWKRGVRATAANRWATLGRVVRQGSLRRLVDRDFQPLFICGAAGSGTTLLSALLDQTYENGLALRESARHPQAHRLLFFEKALEYPTLDEYIEDLFLPARVSAGRVRHAVLTLYRRAADYPKASAVVLDKAPNAHLVRLGALLAAFPEAQAIVLARDPVEVVEGMRRKWPQPFGAAGLEALCDFWNLMHHKALQDTESLENVLVVGYGQLVQQPETVTAAIATWAGLTARQQPKPLRDRKAKPGKGLRNVVAGEIQVVADAGAAARQNLNQAERQLIRERTGAVYAQLHSREMRL